MVSAGLSPGDAMTSIGSLVIAPPAPPTILLVDDDQDSLEMYAVALRHDGFAVTKAMNGADALDRAVTLLPDLVVTDLVMPILDGLTLCRRLRGDPRTRHTPIIAVTARTVGCAEMAQLAGDEATTLLYKPCDPLRLLDEIRRKLEASRELRERSAKELERA
jgi:CheY-like chemotaxis protein